MENHDIVKRISDVSHILNDDPDLDILLNEIGSSKVVLLGEASHGTHEYYTWRSRISKRLIEEKGFSIIAVEGDWPDCYKLNRYIKGYENSGTNAKEVLMEFNRWPTWMWANWEIVALAEWLKKYNSTLAHSKGIGFYGLDVYSLWESMEAIFAYLEKEDPVAFKSVQQAMNCFEPYNVKEGLSYAKRSYGISRSCQEEVVKLLNTIRERTPHFDTDDEAVFNAEQNALVALNAERYYHAMLGGGESTWNIRDGHMAETATRLMNFYGTDSKIIIWEHNTHIGDARATNMKDSGLVNIGQLLKEQLSSKEVYSIGFGSYEGSVIAGYNWGAEMQNMPVPSAKKGSWEQVLHKAGAVDKIILSKDIKEFKKTIGHRAIGVVYDPDFEYGNYVPSIIPKRYEAFIYLDKTTALHPLHMKADTQNIPQTYPFGV
jgi:erythromycin esterase-like protein